MLSAFKNFGVTFIIALVIFGVSAYFATSFVANTMNSIMSSEKEQLDDIFEHKDENPEQSGRPGAVDESVGEIEGDGFSFLLVVTDYRPDLYADYMPGDAQALNEKAWNMTDKSEAVGYLSADYRTASAVAIVLVRADKEKKQYTYTYFSPESRVYTPTGYHTLGEVYSYYGTDTLTEHIHALTGILPSYQLVVNGYNLDELVALLGSVTVNLSRDVYFDGSAYTTRYEYTQEAVGADGLPYTEHIPNAYVLGAGAVELNAENIYVLSSLSERSMSDISMKEAYTVEAVRLYLEKLASLDAEQQRIVLSQLTLNESEWPGVEGLEYLNPDLESESGESAEPVETVEPEETVAETEPESGEESEPTEDDGEGEDGDEEEEEIFLFEPETPILETESAVVDVFTVAELDKIRGVLGAISTFENTTVTYPGAYVDATEDSSAYFEPNLKTGLARFMTYRGATE